MTDKQYKATKLRITKSLDFWIPALGLKWQRKINTLFKDNSDDVPADVVASTNAEWEYQHASVTFYCNRLLDSTDEEIDYFVRHELCHILVAPMSAVKRTDANQKLEELTVTKLAQALEFVQELSKGKK